MSWPHVGRRVLLASGLCLLVFTLAGLVLAAVAASPAWLACGLAADALVLVTLFARSQHNLAVEHAERVLALDARLSALGDRLEANATYEPGRPLDLLRRDLQRDVSAVVALNGLVPVPGAVPAPGGWAATPDTLLAIVARILDADRIDTVVECGSGTSTVWIALALRQRGSGRLVSLENSAEYADATREALRRLGLEDWVDLRVAPLATATAGEDEVLWYDPEALSGVEDVSLLFVDGPPAHYGPRMRYPAVPLLADRLSPGAWVILDDVDRPDEQEIETAWLSRAWGGVTLSRIRTADRASILAASR
jgi:predicted O-methyltransferase YrrM